LPSSPVILVALRTLQLTLIEFLSFLHIAVRDDYLLAGLEEEEYPSNIRLTYT